MVYGNAKTHLIVGGGSSETVRNVVIFDEKVTEKNGKIITKMAVYTFSCLVLIQVRQFQDVKM